MSKIATPSYAHEAFSFNMIFENITLNSIVIVGLLANSKIFPKAMANVFKTAPRIPKQRPINRNFLQNLFDV